MMGHLYYNLAIFRRSSEDELTVRFRAASPVSSFTQGKPKIDEFEATIHPEDVGRFVVCMAPGVSSSV